MEENDSLDIRILSIAENKSLTYINRWEIMRYTGTDIHVDLTAKFSMNRSSSIATVELGAHYSALRLQVMRRLLDYTVRVKFEIFNLSGLVDIEYGDMLVPPGLLRMMLGVSLGALRGMIAVYTAHTFLANFPLPLYDLNEIINSMTLNADVTDIIPPGASMRLSSETSAATT